MTEEIFDATAVAHDDALLSALGAGAAVDDDGVGALLNAWRDELVAAPVPPATSLGSRSELATRRRRLSRGAAAGLITAALVAGGGVAAAAASGPAGPFGSLHRVLFGGPSHSTPADRVAALLDTARQRIDAARRAGGVHADEREAITALLDQAAGILAAQPGAPAPLVQQVADLRSELAALPDIGAPAQDVPSQDAPATPAGTAPSSGAAAPTAGGTDGASVGGSRGGPGNESSDGPEPGSSDGGSDGGSVGGSTDTRDGATSGGGSNGGSSNGGGSNSDGGGSGGGGSSGAPPSPSPSAEPSTSSDSGGKQPASEQ